MPKDRDDELNRHGGPTPEFTLEEIADTLGIAPGTVSARLTRAKRKLRPMLEEWYYD